MRVKKASILQQQSLVFWALSLAVLISGCGHKPLRANHIYSTTTHMAKPLSQVTADFAQGTVVVIGSSSTNERHQLNINEFIDHLAKQPTNSILLTSEYLAYTHQAQLDALQDRLIDESVFLKAVEWPLPDHKELIKRLSFPLKYNHIRFFGATSPRRVIQKVAHLGIESLGKEDIIFLPPNPTFAKTAYLQRTLDSIEQHKHLSENQRQNLHWAQSLWDDTIAWQIAKRHQQNPHSIILVFVDNTLVDYGDGLPDRLQARGVNNIRTISYVSMADLSARDKRRILNTDRQLGPRADYIAVTE